VHYNALSNLDQKFKKRTKGVVSSEEKDSKKIGTKQEKNSKKAGKKVVSRQTRAHVKSRQYPL
jgi:hypothetical protein